MLHRLLLSLMTASALALDGCALSPQQLDPQLVLRGPLTAVGHDQPVVVKTVDGRPGPSLGTCGGPYADTSTLIARSGDVAPKLQAQVETAVHLFGYAPSASAYNASQLTPILAELKYQSLKDGIYVTRADIIAIFRIDVQNSSRRYIGRYGASLNQRSGMALNQTTNSKLVGEVLGGVLTCVFKDPTIAQTLGQQ